MKIAVDFDGTLVEHEYPKIGPEVPGAVDSILAWQDAGAKIMLWTVRSNQPLRDAVDWCRHRGIKLHGVNENPDQKYWAQGPKMYAELYIDAAAYGCPTIHPEESSRPFADWDIIGPEVLELIERKKEFG